MDTEAPVVTDERSMADVDGAASAGAADAPPSGAMLAPAGPAQRVLPWLSASHVAAAVREQEPAFGACQELGSGAESRAHEGAITVGWLVDADGSVSDVTLGRSTFTSDLVNDCMLSVARKVTFPRSRSSAQVSWTVHLRGSEGSALAEAGRYRDHR